MTAWSASLMEEGTRCWPGVELAEERVRETWERLSDTVDGPSQAHAADVFLVTACLELNPAALAYLEKVIRSLSPRFHGYGLGDAQVQALAQDTLSSLVMGKALLKRYSGRGSLEGWLLVVMSRRALELQAQSKKSVELDEVLLGNLESGSAAPELELLKERFRGSFSQAFRVAIGKLGARRRNLLRQHYLDQLSLDEMSVLYRVHRSTVARWLADARAALLDETRTEVCQKLGVHRHEVESLMRVVSS
jgi:RNA polymerase sigma-70 factor (ECF subfamily)